MKTQDLTTEYIKDASLSIVEINNVKTVAVDLKLLVANQGFSTCDDIIVIDAVKKGFAFRYKHVDGIPDLGTDTEMHVTCSFDLPAGWKNGDSIKIISFNENDSTIFHQYQPYFVERVNDDDCDDSNFQFLNFNNEWNARNPLMKVITYIDGTEKSFDAPRLTKKGIILSLQ